MRALGVLSLILLVAATPCSAQSLFIRQGERAFELSAGWSVGPFSNGLETHAGLSIDGRWDVGFGVNRYVADFGGDEDTTSTEWTPFARYFVYKEGDDGTPVTLAAHAQFVQTRLEGDDTGWYVLAGGQLYKRLELAEGLALYPFVGFSLAGESYVPGGAGADRAVYLTRQFGVHGQIAVGSDVWLRLSAEEHSFRRETYRAVRLAVVIRP